MWRDDHIYDRVVDLDWNRGLPYPQKPRKCRVPPLVKKAPAPPPRRGYGVSADHLLLHGNKLLDATAREAQEREEFLLRERLAFRRALDLDDARPCR